jgi:hypothetical protein
MASNCGPGEQKGMIIDEVEVPQLFLRLGFDVIGQPGLERYEFSKSK